VFGWRYDIRNEVLGVVHHLLQASFINASDWYPSAEYKMEKFIKISGGDCLLVCCCFLFLFRMILSAEMNLSRNMSVLETGHITGRIW
jgi:hypothetical protein